MVDNGAHFSGEGHLIEGVIFGDPNRTVIPVVVDSDGKLLVDVSVTPGGTQDVNLIKVGGVAFNIGQAVKAASLSVTIASDQGAIPVSQSGSWTVTTVPPANASVNLTQVGGAAITEGQKTMANSVPVVIASDQSPVPVTGTVAVTQSTSPWITSLASTTVTGNVSVIGTKTNNAAGPSTELGVIPALANAASPTWTEGNQVLESVDLTGRQRVRGSLTPNNAAPDADGQMTLTCLANVAAPTYTEGNLVLHSVDLSGNTRVIGTKTNNNAAPTTQIGVMPAIATAGTPTWTEGNQVLLSTNLSGDLRVVLHPASTAGLLTNVQQALTTSALVKGSAGQKYGYLIYNPNSSAVWVFWYNQTTAPTIGSTTNLIAQMGIPALSGANLSHTLGITFSTGIYVAVSLSATSASAPSTGLSITTLYF